MPSSQKLWGILTRKERWGLSWRGWLAGALLVLLAGRVLLLNIYPFLATTHRVDARILVVEGWVPDYAIVAAANEFKSGAYQQVCSTGGPPVGSGPSVASEYDTEAHWGAARLRKLGITGELVQKVPSYAVDRDRTYSSATALRNWLREHNPSVHAINIVTKDVHARRTRLLFQKALGNSVEVGIIAAQNPDYDPRHWWRYSEGVRDVIGEGLAYIYARFIFAPSE